MRAHKVVLNIQDTTELDFNARQTAGLSYEAQRGMYLHPTYVISPEREPLGVLNAWMWARKPKDGNGTRPGIKESLRWIKGYERVAERAKALPEVRQVDVSDREGDKLWARLAQAPVLGRVRFEIPVGRGRKVRSVQQHIRAEQVQISDGAGEKLSVTCVLAEEINPPTGATPVVWRLLSNRTVNTLEEAVELVDWYRARWEIEVFFLILKEGCRINRLMRLGMRDNAVFVEGTRFARMQL